MLAEGEKIYPFQKYAQVVLEPFSLDVNERKILTQLYQEIKDEAYEACFLETNEIQNRLVRYMDELLMKVPYPLTYTEELDMAGLLKLMKVSIESDAETFLEKIVQYLRIMSSLCRIKVIFFMNLKFFLKEEELRALYREAAYCKIQLVLIEGFMRDKMEEEDICIIDSDLCIIRI